MLKATGCKEPGSLGRLGILSGILTSLISTCGGLTENNCLLSQEHLYCHPSVCHPRGIYIAFHCLINKDAYLQSNAHYIQDNVLFGTPRRIAGSESTQIQKAFETDFWVDLASFKNPEDTTSWHTSNMNMTAQNMTAEAHLTYLNGSRSYEPFLRTCRALHSSVWCDLTQALEVTANITTKGSPYRSRPLAIVYNNFIWGTGLLTPGGGW